VQYTSPFTRATTSSGGLVGREPYTPHIHVAIFPSSLIEISSTEATDNLDLANSRILAAFGALLYRDYTLGVASHSHLLQFVPHPTLTEEARIRAVLVRIAPFQEANHVPTVAGDAQNYDDPSVLEPS